MRLTIVVLGWTFDWTAEPTATDEPEDTARDLSGGSTGSTPMGFTAQWGDQRWQPSPELE